MLLQPIAQLDLNVSLKCLDHRFNQQVATVSRVVSRTGDGPLYVMFGLIALWLDTVVGWAFFCVTLAAFAFELPIYWAAKNSVKRRRPAELNRVIPTFITPSDRYSLPSGHSAAAMVMATSIAHFYPTLAIGVFVWALAVGLSRILLGVHFLTDVLIGMALGMASANAAITLFAR